jgi:hypothetical protein
MLLGPRSRRSAIFLGSSRTRSYVSHCQAPMLCCLSTIQEDITQKTVVERAWTCGNEIESQKKKTAWDPDALYHISAVRRQSHHDGRDYRIRNHHTPPKIKTSKRHRTSTGTRWSQSARHSCQGQARYQWIWSFNPDRDVNLQRQQLESQSHRIT